MTFDTTIKHNILKNSQIDEQHKKKKEKFNFDYMKILIQDKNNKDDVEKEVLLSRKWIKETNAIPHFAKYSSNIDKDEGIEITINCNVYVF